MNNNSSSFKRDILLEAYIVNMIYYIENRRKFFLFSFIVFLD